MADQIQWFVRKGDKTHGPFSSQQLKQLAKGSKISPDSPVRRGNEGQWVAAQKVKGLFAATKPSEELATVPKPQPPMVVESHPTPAHPLPTAIIHEQQSQVATRIPCPFCGEEIAETAKKCRHCNEFLDGRPREQPHPVQQVVAMAPPPAQQPNVNVVVNQQTNVGTVGRRWSPLLAMFLSFIIPGLGQLYKGQLITGLLQNVKSTPIER